MIFSHAATTTPTLSLEYDNTCATRFSKNQKFPRSPGLQGCQYEVNISDLELLSFNRVACSPQFDTITNHSWLLLRLGKHGKSIACWLLPHDYWQLAANRCRTAAC